MSVPSSNLDVPRELVAGKYQLTRILGRGGMGSVWEGVHTTLGTRVAVKFIESEYADSAEARQRFENEARAAATLRSKHVVQVYDHGVMPDGRPFIVMEFLAGEPLDKRLDRLGRLPVHETVRIVQHVCRALSKAHEAGIVHRDLKPENVFLVWDEEDGTDIAKVVDFGIAKFTDKSLGVSSSTRTGSVLGTPFYMSPEQARGLRTVDYRSDLWSVGVIAFRCLIGRLPFEGEAVGDLLVKLCTAPLPVPTQWASDIPPGFDAWFQKALDREPAQRFSSAPALAEALAAACGMPASRVPMQSSMEPMPGRVAAPVAAATPYGTPGPWGYGTPGSATQPSTPNATSNPAALTGAPFTQTSAGIQRTSRKGPLVVLGLVSLVIVAVGIGLAVKFLKGAQPVTPEPTAAAASAVTAAAAVPTPAAPAPTVAPTTSAPPPEPAAGKPTVESDSEKAAATSKTAAPNRPRSTTTSKPKPTTADKPKPAGTKQSIDVGY